MADALKITGVLGLSALIWVLVMILIDWVRRHHFPHWP